MNKKNSAFLILLLSVSIQAQVLEIGIDPSKKIETGDDLLESMHQVFKIGPCKAYTFSQKNTHYKNDSITGNSEWHESVEFPDKFRIDFGDTKDGNFVIFKKDSVYRYKNSVLKNTNYDSNTLLLLLGGMYYRSLSDVTLRLQNEHYNTHILSTQKIGKEHFYVIGALKGDTLSNQIWVNKHNWKVFRIIEKMDETSIMDMTFDSYQKHCNGFVETKVTFKRNGKKEQVEEYYNIKEVSSFPPEVFNPKQ